METGRNFAMLGINSEHYNLPTYEILLKSNIQQCWICEVLWGPFWKWWPVEIVQCQESIRDIIIYPHIKFWWYRTILNFYCPFLCRVLAAILKMADILKIAPLMVTYHFIKSYVSIIIYLEVININVWNFNIPIGFYSNPQPFEPLKIWLWPPLPQSWKL